MSGEWPKSEKSDIGADGELLVVTSIGVAALLGVSRQRVSQLLKAGDLPEPLIPVNGLRPGWLPSQFLEAKAPLPSCNLDGEPRPEEDFGLPG